MNYEYIINQKSNYEKYFFVSKFKISGYWLKSLSFKLSIYVFNSPDWTW